MMKKGITQKKRMVLSQERERDAKKEKEKLSNLPHKTEWDHDYEDIGTDPGKK